MIPTEVFDRFAQGDSLPLMAQAVMENALSPRSSTNSSRRPPTGSTHAISSSPRSSG